MDKYNPQNIEKKWQKIWAKNPDFYVAREDSDKEKRYILDMFPYPSGEGLHVGHVESYTATDIISRYLRMNGKNVFHPQGWDAFGLPAENYAIKTKIHPAQTTQKSIATFKGQMNKMGFSYDWSREVNSSDPDYYKWTQWFFLLLYKNGWAYKKLAKTNWCPSCQTVLANEQVISGRCERCGTEVIQKDLEQWFFKITDFIEDNKKTTGLIAGLDKIDWPESTKAAQKNWIGRSEGTQFKMPIAGSDLFIEVYTTRLDTVYGITYAVVAPEHPIVAEIKGNISNWSEIEKYLKNAKKKTDLERMEAKEKTGVELKGVRVINPFNNEEVPLYVADYVLSHYGTGAVMAVPAHDERDWEFARKYNLPIKEVIVPSGKKIVGSGALIETPEGKFIFQKRDQNTDRNPGKIAPFGGGVEKGESFESCLKRELKEEINLDLDLAKVFSIGKIESHSLPGNFINLYYVPGISAKNLKVDEGDGLIELSLNEALKNEKVTEYTKEVIRHFITTNNFAYTEDGAVVNSEKYNSINSKEVREKMTAWLKKNKIGEKKINYKIRDWLVSRQRYWGAPIPIIYCDKCGTVPVPEKDLPVLLPTDVDFKPTGESPLKYSKKFQDVKCPKCGGKAKRESDTMDTFVCSSWYYFRYSDPKNEKEFASKKQIKKWMPVDLYVGGMEHAVLHLLYSRFFTKVLHNLGYIDFDEPFLKLNHQGIILAEDGRKMSKSLGNVVNPDDIVKEFGADSLRLFEMFMGPLEDMKPWNTRGIIGTQRFLEKIFRCHERLKDNFSEETDGLIEIVLNKTIKKVTQDIENLRFNTAISQMMIFLNMLYKNPEDLRGSKLESERKMGAMPDVIGMYAMISKEDFEKFLVILSPFAPHIAEELWEKLGHEESIFLQSWPAYDPDLIKDEEIELVVQVNGKLRDKIKVNADISEEEAKKLATESEKIKNFIAEKEIKKIIFVKGRLINIVIK